MNHSWNGLLLLTVLMGIASVAAPAIAADEIEIDGSSTVYKISQIVAEEFAKDNKSASISVKYAGTSGGFKRFVTGELAICDASRPIQTKEIKAAADAGTEYIELPIAFDAITVAVNAKNDWLTEISVEDLAKIWKRGSKMVNWKDVNPKWPAEKISLHGAGKSSGTYEYFTEAITEKKGNSRDDVSTSENDNLIIQGIAGDNFAMGYIPLAYYEANTDKLKALKISHDGKTFVEPTVETVKDGTYNPLSRPLFIYVNKKAAAQPAMKKFVDYYLANAADFAKKAGYVALPAAAYKMAQTRFAKLQSGTGFGGHSAIGMKLEDILKKEPK